MMMMVMMILRFLEIAVLSRCFFTAPNRRKMTPAEEAEEEKRKKTIYWHFCIRIAEWLNTTKT